MTNYTYAFDSLTGLMTVMIHPVYKAQKFTHSTVATYDPQGRIEDGSPRI